MAARPHRLVPVSAPAVVTAAPDQARHAGRPAASAVDVEIAAGIDGEHGVSAPADADREGVVSMPAMPAMLRALSRRRDGGWRGIGGLVIRHAIRRRAPRTRRGTTLDTRH